MTLTQEPGTRHDTFRWSDRPRSLLDLGLEPDGARDLDLWDLDAGREVAPAPAETTVGRTGKGRRLLVFMVIVVALVAGLAGATAKSPIRSTAKPILPGPGSRAVDSIVDVLSPLSNGQGALAGTGIVLNSSGVVLTNNHVIDGGASTLVFDLGSGRTYPATVLGYDVSADVAVLELAGATALVPADIGNSSSAAVGEAVTGLGNAGGVGGLPSAAPGAISGLDVSLSAINDALGTTQTLTGLIQTSAPIQCGDSGGPLLDSSGQVIGMDTATTAGYGKTVSGYAIPINRALSIADQIRAGRRSARVHIGPTPFLGAEVEAAPTAGRPGVRVVDVSDGSPAAGAGLAGGDVLVSVGSHPVDSAAALSAAVARYRPGATVAVAWLNSSGARHTARVKLASGPPA